MLSVQDPIDAHSRDAGFRLTDELLRRFFSKIAALLRARLLQWLGKLSKAPISRMQFEALPRVIELNPLAPPARKDMLLPANE